MTPLSKKPEQKGHVRRERSEKNERHLFIVLTDNGRARQKKALCVRETIS